MQTNDVKLRVLLDLIGKKKALLTQILTICENQESILSAERNEELDRMFIEMGNEKQALVDEVIATDNFFQKVFDELGENFERTGEDNKDVIKLMQSHIMGVTELDTKIRLAENRNVERITRTRAQPVKPSVNQVSKQHLLKQYKSHDKHKRGSIE
ncbi:MAG: hypothetical protein FWD96_03000 [Defluviitaleaceae bacterium]|nr:hypothetical protein [Defluviitaleaceae bacterium]